MEKTQRNPELLNFMLLSIWELSGGTSYKEVLLKEVLHNLNKLNLNKVKLSDEQFADRIHTNYNGSYILTKTLLDNNLKFIH